MQRARAGFTLIELLVVIAIIAILAALLMPALESARESAQTSGCVARMKNLSIAFAMYANIYEDAFPQDMGCYNSCYSYSAGCQTKGPLKGFMDYNAASGGHWNSALNKLTSSCMGAWCNQAYEFIGTESLLLCDSFIAHWQEFLVYAEGSYDFTPYGVLPDYAQYNYGREVVPCNYFVVCGGIGWPTNRVTRFADIIKKGETFLLDHEHWGECAPRVPQYMANAYDGWSRGVWPGVHNLRRGHYIYNAYFTNDRARWVAAHPIMYADLHVQTIHYDDVYKPDGGKAPGWGYPW